VAQVAQELETKNVKAVVAKALRPIASMEGRAVGIGQTRMQMAENKAIQV